MSILIHNVPIGYPFAKIFSSALEVRVNNVSPSSARCREVEGIQLRAGSDDYGNTILHSLNTVW